MTNNIQKLFKIRDKETGLFSRGGSDSRNIWTKSGKAWSNIGHIKNHLHAFIDRDGEKSSNYPYDNAEIIEVELNYDDCFHYDVEEMYDVMAESKAKQDESYRRRQDKWLREYELKQLEKLKEKYEKKQ